MHMGKMICASLFLAAFAAPMFAQGAVGAPTRNAVEPVKGDLRRAQANDEEIDVPAAPTKVAPPRIGSSVTNNSRSNAPGLDESAPVEDLNDGAPPPPVEGPATFFGEQVSGRFIWCIDRSHSMGEMDSGASPVEMGGTTISNPSRLQIAKAEAIRAINQLVETDEFAVVNFGGCPGISAYTSMKKANDANKQAGISGINQLVAFGFTPIHGGLKKAAQTSTYGYEVDALFFLSDGLPTYGPGAAQVLIDFPTWYFEKREYGCKLHVIHIGQASGPGADFMQQLAAANGGTFLHKN